MTDPDKTQKLMANKISSLQTKYDLISRDFQAQKNELVALKEMNASHKCTEHAKRQKQTNIKAHRAMRREIQRMREIAKKMDEEHKQRHDAMESKLKTKKEELSKIKRAYKKFIKDTQTKIEGVNQQHHEEAIEYDLETTKTDKQTAERELNDLREEKSKIYQELEAVQSDLERVSASKQELDERYHALQKEHDDQNTKIYGMKQEHRALLVQHEETKNNLISVRGRNEELKSKIKGSTKCDPQIKRNKMKRILREMTNTRRALKGIKGAVDFGPISLLLDEFAVALHQMLTKQEQRQRHRVFLQIDGRQQNQNEHTH